MDGRINNLMSEYFSTKDLARRNAILKELSVRYPEGAEDFFSESIREFLDSKK